MDQRILTRVGVMNENAQLIPNKMNILETPSKKLPFMDATNKGMLKSAIKPNHSTQKNENKKVQQQEDVGYDNLDFSEFKLPHDRACFCCGSNRKSDAEIYGQRLALSNELIDRLLSVPDNIYFEPSPPPSPIKVKPIPMMDTSYDLDYDIEMPIKTLHIKSPYGTYDFESDDEFHDAENSDDDSFNSSLNIPEPPEFDFDFTIRSDHDISENETSLISDW